MDNPESELERASDWIDNDPDFKFIKMHRSYFPRFADFCDDLRLQDNPVACQLGECAVPPLTGAGGPNGHSRRHRVLPRVASGTVSRP